MEKEWESFKSIKGCMLMGIYAKALSMHQFKNELILHPVETILEIRNPKSFEIKYWKLSWTETTAGDDLLIVKEQDTPEPLQYESIDAPYQKHIITGSSFFVQHNVIKKVSGYGFNNDGSRFLTSIILELEESFISIQAGAAIEIRITSKKPKDFGNIIFATTL
ncbi:hypothetical protein QNH39_15295 [Neobacillus novalis]|uniref:Uncharacterized protein n=1 Tax=Neobacillus novalis TaxID=220687 RepID=A0AA95MI31_9BACI|nr:hypothetical protein [Neobacillus novalis]WHY84046.1 hypothetical protein QNH39_15295 [Neobacillus novalis]